MMAEVERPPSDEKQDSGPPLEMKELLDVRASIERLKQQKKQVSNLLALPSVAARVELATLSDTRRESRRVSICDFASLEPSAQRALPPSRSPRVLTLHN